MVQRNGVRLVAEVVLLFAAAAIAGPVLHLGALAIVGVVVVVWGTIAVFEYGRAHPQAPRRSQARPMRPERAPAAVPAGDDEPALEGVRVLGSRPARPPEPEPVAQPAPEPLTEPVVAAAVTAAAEAADAAPPPLPPAPEPVAAAPEPEPGAAVPEPESEPEPEPEPAVVGAAPWSWNVWNLERVVRERAASNDELNYLLLYLREYANPAGMLPPDFDALVRESFGDLLAAPS